MGCAWYKEYNRRGGICMQAAAAGDPGASPGRGPQYDDTMEKELYYLEMDSMKSSWKAWQRGLYSAARKYDHYLFTKDEILAVGHWLDGLRKQYRNSEAIMMPSWAFCNEYGTSPHITLGYGCTLVFRPVAGFFGNYGRQ